MGQSPASSSPFSAKRSALGFDICAVDRCAFGHGARCRQSFKQIDPKATAGPPIEAVINLEHFH